MGITFGAILNGGRLALLTEGFVTLRFTPPRGGVYERRGMRMLTIEGLIAVICLCITCFSLGYNVGRNQKAQK